MKWQGRRGSSNIEDRRRMGGGRLGGRGGGGGVAVGGAGGLGILAIVVIGYFLGVDLTPLLGADGGVQSGPSEVTQADEQAAQFVSVTLADTEDVWSNYFQSELGQTYAPATLVLFKGATQSACGGANAATGPFYCPVDKKVYLDTDFFVLMDRQLGAGGDFAQAYVVAHEIGHHVQDLLGILDQTDRARSQASEADSNAISVMVELQADCFAGVWANRAQEQFGSLEPGDIAEAMNAAEQIGDDTLQREAGRAVVPDSFTHGTSAQRQRWFEAGYDSGSIAQCDTFSARQL